MTGPGNTLRSPQVPACDRCTQGVMDATNPHMLGECECECHKLIELREREGSWGDPYERAMLRQERR